MYPQLKTYSSKLSSKEKLRLKEKILKQKELNERLSPKSVFYKTESRFFGNKKRNSSFYKDFETLVLDPISIAVEENRAK